MAGESRFPWHQARPNLPAALGLESRTGTSLRAKGGQGNSTAQKRNRWGQPECVGGDGAE